MSDSIQYTPTMQYIDAWANQMKMRPRNCMLNMNFGLNTNPINIGTPSFNFNCNFNNTSATSTEDSFSKFLRELDEKSKPSIEAAQKESQRQEVQRSAKQDKAQMDENIAQLKAQKKSIEKNKKSDGSSYMSNIHPAYEEVEETKKDGTKEKVKKVKKKELGEKIFGFLSNSVKGIKDMFAGLVGFEKDGSWNPWKLVKNVAITAVVGTACFFCPPLGTALLYGGLAMGTVGMVKNGVERWNAGDALDAAIDAINNAKTDEERQKAEEAYIKAQQAIDESEQSFGQNAFLAVTSGRGAFKAGQASRLAAQSSSAGASNVTSAGRWTRFFKGEAISAKSRTSWLGKRWEGFANGFYDTFANPVSTIKTQSIDYAASVRTNGFWKTGRENIKSAWNANTTKGKYEAYKSEMEQRYADKITNIDNEISAQESIINNASSTPEQVAQATKARSMLWEEKKFVLNCQSDFQKMGTTVTNKADYDKLMTDNAAIKGQEKLGQYTTNANGKYELSGSEFTPDEFAQFKANMSSYLGSQQKEFTSIINQHTEVMLSKAGIGKTILRKYRNNANDQAVKAELEAYAPTSSVSWWKNWSPFGGLTRTKQAVAIGSPKSGFSGWWNSTKQTMDYLSLSPTTAPKFIGMLDPVANMGNLIYIAPKKVKEENEYIDSVIKTQEEIKSKMAAATTDEELNICRVVQAQFLALIEQSNMLVAQGNKREKMPSYDEILNDIKKQYQEMQAQAAIEAEQNMNQTQTQVSDATSVDNTNARIASEYPIASK